MPHTFTKKTRAFTLIEMLIVVVIIGILAAVLIPRLQGAQARSRDASRTVKTSQISAAIDVYKEDKGAYPIAPFNNPGNETAQSTVAMIPEMSSYMSSIPTDPGKGIAAVKSATNSCVITGNSFGYSSDEKGSMFAVTSISESKKGNTTNCVGVVDALHSASYQVAGQGLKYTVTPDGGNGAGGGASEPDAPGIYYVGNDIIVKNATTRIVIANKNVGATEPGTGVSSYGYFFQWGNNYGFPSQGTITPSSTLVSNPTPPYSSSTFVTATNSPYDWATPQNTNLRPEKTQGPCPTGYHIPSQQEWVNLKSAWDSIPNKGAGNIGDVWMNTLKIPKAGSRSNGNASVSNQGSFGYYWSSAPFSARSYAMYFGSSFIVPSSFSNRAYGFSVRCFRNSQP